MSRRLRSTARSTSDSSIRPSAIAATSGAANPAERRQLAVEARAQRHRGGGAQVAGQPMLADEHLDRGVVRGDDPVEAPFVAQDLGQQLVRDVAREPVDVAVGGHHAREPGDADGGLEREQLLVAHLARPEVDRRLVEAALGEPVADEVLAGRDDPGGDVVALHPADVRDAELGGEVRVLAIGLLDAAPARVAGGVEDRGERQPAADGEHAPADRGRDGLDELGVEGCRRADRLLERGRPAGEQAVERLLVEDRWDPESGLLDEVALDRVAGLGRAGGIEVGGARHAADLAHPGREPLADPRLVELALALEQLERPDRPELGDLLGQRHPGEEVGDPLLDRQAGVAVAGLDRRHQPFTAPEVRPPTSWRSAIA